MTNAKQGDVDTKPKPGSGSPSELVVSSTIVSGQGGHDEVQVWSRGGFAGTLIVDRGDGPELAQRLEGGGGGAAGGVVGGGERKALRSEASIPGADEHAFDREEYEDAAPPAWIARLEVLEAQVASLQIASCEVRRVGDRVVELDGPGVLTALACLHSVAYRDDVGGEAGDLIKDYVLEARAAYDRALRRERGPKPGGAQ